MCLTCLWTSPPPPFNLQTAAGEDLINSTLYSLLNNLTSSSAALAPNTNGAHYASSTRSAGREAKLETMTVKTVGATVGGPRTDEQTKQVNASTIAVVTRLAIEFKQSEVRMPCREMGEVGSSHLGR